MASRSPPTVIILGGGVSGLTAAYVLTEKFGEAICVTIFEENADCVGGCASVADVDGFRFDSGVHSFRSTDNGRVTLDLAKKLGVHVLTPTKTARANRYVLWQGRLQRLGVALILRLVGLIPLLAEAIVVPQRHPSLPEETVAQFFHRRFGPMVVNVFVDAFISGVFAGDSRKLSMSAVFRSVVAMEQRRGSVLLDALIGGESAATRKVPTNVFGDVLDDKEVLQQVRDSPSYTFPGGMTDLPNAILSRLCTHRTFSLHLGTRVTQITTKGDRKMKVTVRQSSGSHHAEEHICDYVISAIPSHVLARILGPNDALVPSFRVPIGPLEAMHKRVTHLRGLRRVRSLLHTIPFRPIDVVHVGLKGEDPCHSVLPARHYGFGYLVPRLARPTESDPILGVIFDSCAFPSRYPLGSAFSVMLRGITGRQRPHAELQGYATRALAVAGVSLLGQSVVWNYVRWSHAIPQYTRGHTERVREIRERIQRHWGPRLSLCGYSYDGIGFNDAVVSGRDAALALSGPLMSTLRPTEESRREGCGRGMLGGGVVSPPQGRSPRSLSPVQNYSFSTDEGINRSN